MYEVQKVDLLPEHPRTIVRVKTDIYDTRRGAVIKKSITTLKRKSVGYDLLNDELYHLDLDQVVLGITNLYNVDDGVYQMVVGDCSYDYETGYLDDYNYKLIPFNEEMPNDHSG